MARLTKEDSYVLKGFRALDRMSLSCEQVLGPLINVENADSTHASLGMSLTTSELLAREFDVPRRLSFERAAFQYHCGNFDAAVKIYERVLSANSDLLTLLEYAEAVSYIIDNTRESEILQLTVDHLTERSVDNYPFNNLKQNILFRKRILLQLASARFHAFVELAPVRQALRELRQAFADFADPDYVLNELDVSTLKFL